MADVAVMELLREALKPWPAVTDYEAVLAEALAKEPAYYGREAYIRGFQKAATDAAWFARYLVSNADMEGYSGRQLWHYAQSVEDSALRREMQRHARDELRHSKIFGQLLCLIFPHLDTASVRRRLEAFAPSVETLPKANKATRRGQEELVMTMALANLHELKALILERLLEPILLAYSPGSVAAKVQSLAATLIRDELRHIHYTAEFLDKCLRTEEAEFVREALFDFHRTLNSVTESEHESASLGERLVASERHPARDMV